ncbi:hypothetical protein UFOVP519_10 [uncultured Caudovirales phage]|uniref:Uncharacterized protein n=1 Tax=uncultured Caudovirales phage TaxID=2100421 RepID=A0A6J5MLC7_9CAUD|nr:hypothetical protein UFOVP519_10 [uncultured Caudovirales phage]
MNKNIQALLHERAGYSARNLPARIKAVDDALRELGFEHKLMTTETATAEPQEERASIAPPAKRKKA